MKKLLLAMILTLFSFSSTLAVEVCMEFQVNQQGINHIKLKTHEMKGYYSIIIKHGKKIEDNYYSCYKDEDHYSCDGSDDTGSFRFEIKEKTLVIDNLTFGDPDIPQSIYRVGKTGVLKGKDCE